MATSTFAELKSSLKVQTEFLGDFSADFEIPVLSGPQCQGDVSICPVSEYPTKVSYDKAVAVTTKGYEVIRGGAMNNAHTLRTLDKRVTFAPAARQDLVLGKLTIPEGAEAYLEHPEHGFNGIAPGEYVIGRQREQAEQLRMVQD